MQGVDRRIEFQAQRRDLPSLRVGEGGPGDDGIEHTGNVATRPLLRHLSNTLKKWPIVKRFGVSQALVCRK